MEDREFAYKTSTINEYKCDIFEVGAEIVAFAVEWKYVEPMIKFLNSLKEE